MAPRTPPPPPLPKRRLHPTETPNYRIISVLLYTKIADIASPRPLVDNKRPMTPSSAVLQRQYDTEYPYYVTLEEMCDRPSFVADNIYLGGCLNQPVFVSATQFVSLILVLLQINVVCTYLLVCYRYLVCYVSNA